MNTTLPIQRFAAVLLLAAIGCGGPSAPPPPASGEYDEDPFSGRNVTVHSSKPELRASGPAPTATPPSKPSSPWKASQNEPDESYTSNPSQPYSLPARTSPPTQQNTMARLIGNRAPNLDVAVAGGGVLNLADHRGSEVLVVALWASYNNLCEKHLSTLKRVADRFGEPKVKLLAVNDGETPAVISRYLTHHKLDLPVGVDPDQEVANAFKVQQLPFVAIIDDQGNVQGIHLGLFGSLDRDVEADVAAILRGEDITEQSKQRLNRRVGR